MAHPGQLPPAPGERGPEWPNGWGLHGCGSGTHRRGEGGHRGGRARSRAREPRLPAHPPGRLHVVAETASGAETIEEAGRREPDFVVLALPLPGPAPGELIARLRAVSPRSRLIVVVDDPARASVGLLAGLQADALVMATAGPEALLAAIRAPRTRWPAELAAPAPVGRLSIRQIEVLRLAAEGLSNREIAAALHISPGTVKRHLADTFRRLGAHSRLGAVTRAIAVGILPAPAGAAESERRP